MAVEERYTQYHSDSQNRTELCILSRLSIQSINTIIYYYAIRSSTVYCILLHNPFSAANPNRKCGLAGKKSRFQFFSPSSFPLLCCLSSSSSLYSPTLSLSLFSLPPRPLQSSSSLSRYFPLHRSHSFLGSSPCSTSPSVPQFSLTNCAKAAGQPRIRSSHLVKIITVLIEDRAIWLPKSCRICPFRH